MAKRTFEYLWTSLIAEASSLSPPLAQRYISEAWLEIQGEREWSFRNKDGLMIIPASVTTGTINVTKNSASCTLSAAGITAWNAIGANPPLVSLRQLRFPSRPERIYNITSYDSGTGEIVMDKVYTGTTDTVSTYTLYSAYHIPLNVTGSPDPYFERLVSARSLDYGWAFLDDRSLVDRRALDQRDPGRIFYALPRVYCYQEDKEMTLANGDIGTYRRIEIWPHCTSALSYETRYVQRPISFEETDTQYLPEVIEPRYVVLVALARFYRWAEGNRDKLPQGSQRTNFQYLRAQLTSEYPTDRDTIAGYRRKCFARDDEILNQQLIYRTPDYVDNNLLAPSPTLVIAAS